MHVILRCLLCIQCGRAFTPKSMAGHLQKHGIPISEDDKNGLLEFARANSVGDDPRDSPLPTNYGPPVELVPEQDGFACGVGEHSYAFKTEDRHYLFTSRRVPLCFWSAALHRLSSQEPSPSRAKEHTHTRFSPAPVPQLRERLLHRQPLTEKKFPWEPLHSSHLRCPP